jgi:single-strand DNA-binding protein
MASVNKVIILGNLGRDPETRYMPSGDAMTTISIATTDSWKDKSSGEKKESTEWHRVTFFGKLAEIAGQYLKKGSSVYVEGSLRTRKYTDKDGVEKYATDIRADSMQMLGGRPGASSGMDDGGYDSGMQNSAPMQGQGQPRPSAPPAQSRPAPQQSRPAPNFSDMDDDIPF